MNYRVLAGGMVSLLVLAGAGCSSQSTVSNPTATTTSVAPGKLPTEEQLAKMTDAEKNQSMTEELQRNPPKMLTAEQKLVEVKEMRKVIEQGNVRRLGTFQRKTQETMGEARIVKKGNAWYLALSENFSVSPGPSLTVQITDSMVTGTSNLLMGGTQLEVGALKTEVGGQVYPLPANLNPDTVNTVIIYSKPFQVIYGAAPMRDR